MFSAQYRQIVAACSGEKVDAHALAAAICNATVPLNHGGPLTITGGLPVHDRDFSSEDGYLKPDPAKVGLGAMDGAMLTVRNQAEGHSDREGTNGFAADLDGVVRISELWATQFATVDETGVTESGYYYSDGFECTDSLGTEQSVTETPIRVFYLSEDAVPQVGSVVGYQRDKKGIAYALAGASAGTPLPDGTDENDILRWDSGDEEWAIHSAPAEEGKWYLTVDDGAMAWAGFEIPDGTSENDILRWDYGDGAWAVQAAPAEEGKWYLTVDDGAMAWAGFEDPEGVEVTVVTAVSKSGGKVRIKTRTVRVLEAGTESAWTEVDGQTSLVSQSVLTDFGVNGVTLQTKARTIYVDAVGDEGSWTTKHTGTTC